jgi:hypothetical protein
MAKSSRSQAQDSDHKFWTLDALTSESSFSTWFSNKPDKNSSKAEERSDATKTFFITIIGENSSNRQLRRFTTTKAVRWKVRSPRLPSSFQLVPMPIVKQDTTCPSAGKDTQTPLSSPTKRIIRVSSALDDIIRQRHLLREAPRTPVPEPKLAVRIEAPRPDAAAT